jgi:hypothetical protein
VRIAATGDLHCGVTSGSDMRRLLKDVKDQADVLLVAGDLTSLGLAEEMDVLLSEIERLTLPVAAVTGNHDHASDQADILIQMMRSAGVRVLEDDVWEHDGVGFAGAKGFAGGFGQYRLRSFGESVLKAFVREGVSEVMRLERSLAKLQTTSKVVLLHYSPIAATVVGEHPEIFPFLGYSLLGDALDRHSVDIAVHGHAHHGAMEGRTPGGVLVRNVAHQVLSRHTGAPYCLFDV